MYSCPSQDGTQAAWVFVIKGTKLDFGCKSVSEMTMENNEKGMEIFNIPRKQDIAQTKLLYNITLLLIAGYIIKSYSKCLTSYWISAVFVWFSFVWWPI